jgi:hypothetical protein
MLMNVAGAPRLRISPPRHGCFVVPCLLLLLVSISGVGGAAQSDQVAERNLKAFYEAFLGRQMSGSELREVTDEFIKIHMSKYCASRRAVLSAKVAEKGSQQKKNSTMRSHGNKGPGSRTLTIE